MKEPVGDMATTPRPMRACQKDWATAGRPPPAGSRDGGGTPGLPRKPPHLGGIFFLPRRERQSPCSCQCEASRLQLRGLRECAPASWTGREGPGPWAGPSGGWGASASDPEPSGTRTSAGSRLSPLALRPPRPTARAHVLSRLSRP